MDSYTTVTKQDYVFGNGILSCFNELGYWSQLNCLIMGNVSSGKSTFLNGLFGSAIAETHLRRATMFPTRFLISPSDQYPDDVATKAIHEINEDIRTQKIKLTQKHLIDYVSSLRIKSDLDVKAEIPDPFKLCFIDFPGVCDAETNVYDLEVERVLHLCDSNNVSHVIIIINGQQGINTISQRTPIDLVLACVKKRKSPLNIIIVINKCDDLEYIDGRLVPTGEQMQDIVIDIENVIRKKFENIPTAKLFFCPYSANNTLRARFKNLEVLGRHGIDIDSVLEVDYSKNQIRNMTQADKELKILQIKQNTEVTQYLELNSGFSGLVSALKTSFEPKAIGEQVFAYIDEWANRYEKDIDAQSKTKFHFGIFRELKLYQEKLNIEPSSLQLTYKKKLEEVIDAFNELSNDPREPLREYRKILDFKVKVDQKIKGWFTNNCIQTIKECTNALKTNPPKFGLLITLLPKLKGIKETILVAESEDAQIAKDLDTTVLWVQIQTFFEKAQQKRDIADEEQVLTAIGYLSLVDGSDRSQVFMEYLSTPVAGNLNTVKEYYTQKINYSRENADNPELVFGEWYRDITHRDRRSVTFNNPQKLNMLLQRHYQFNLDRELLLQS